MSLCPQPRGSTPSTSVFSLPFLPGSPEATGLLGGMAACAPTCSWEGNGEGRNSSIHRAPGSPGGTEPVACVAFEQLQNILEKQGYGKGLT